MPPRIDISGQKFGKLTAVREVGKKNNRPLWECICECGNTHYALVGKLRIGRVFRCKSCAAKTRFKHGCSNSKKQQISREYRSWSGARKRCNNPTDKSYPTYGGRGIKFSPLWDDFRVFLADMGLCPKGMTLDRIDVNGNYELGNCRWATVKTQQNNRRVNVVLEHKGERLTATEWSERFGQQRNYFNCSLNSGYTAQEIFERLEQGQKYKKLRYRGDNSRASKLTSEDIKNLLEDYHAIPKTSNRTPSGAREALGAKYGITPHYVSAILAGRTHWAECQIIRYNKRK